MNKFFFLASLVLVVGLNSVRGEEKLFPFVSPWDDASPGVTDIAGWLERPAGQDGFVTVKDGHLYAGSKRIRFFGVNMAFGGNFPAHKDAEKIAARLAKFGINCVRFHHMDMFKAPDGIWNADLRTLDPGQLDKLDYFIAKLKERGIYSNLNLHVSWTYPGMPEWAEAPSYFKGVDLFYPPMLELQRNFARDLLTHVNPYTKNSYANEPAVALIEINNENGLISEWWNRSLDKMTEVYAAELRSRWNAWLARRYPSREALQKAWDKGAEVLGSEMIREGKLGQGKVEGDPWWLERHGGAVAAAQPDPDGGLRIQVDQVGREAWHVQLSQPGFALEDGRGYSLKFRAKAEVPRRIRVNVSQKGEPWGIIWSEEISLTPEWREFRLGLRGRQEKEARLVFSNLGEKTGRIWLDDVSLTPGGISGLPAGDEWGKVSLPARKDMAFRTEALLRDWMTFLWEVEEGYWTDMSRFIKEGLKARSLVLGTATGFSPPTIQAKLDVVDAHAYWQHPHFPGRSWDAENWTVGNEPMAGIFGGGALSGLALRKVAGKPFVCTEYNGAAPNTYPGETFLLLSAYAALQDWDGIFIFAWSHRRNDWDTQKITGFFDVDQHPAKLVTLPAAAAMFLRGDVAPAKNEIIVPISRAQGIRASLESGAWWDMSTFQISRNAPLQSRTAFRMEEGAEFLATVLSDETMGGFLASDTGELEWRISDRRVLINTERSKAVIGKAGKGRIAMGDISFEVISSIQGWAAVTLTAMTGNDFHSPGRILLTATGNAENSGMVWTGPDKKSVGKKWGQAPSLVEGIGAKISLPLPPARMKAWALDGRGQRTKEISLQAAGKGSVLTIGPEFQTLWYEIEVGE